MKIKNLENAVENDICILMNSSFFVSLLVDLDTLQTWVTEIFSPVPNK